MKTCMGESTHICKYVKFFYFSHMQYINIYSNNKKKLVLHYNIILSVILTISVKR